MTDVPLVFISYTHDSPEHVDRILVLSDRLRAEGVDCHIDQYEQSPEEGWPHWCARQVKDSAFVLVACTETYLRRFNAEEAPRIGLGGTWEGHIITQELYDAQGRNTKFIPIIFSKDDGQFVPDPLKSATRYQLPDNYDELYRRLTGQPLISKPALGSVKPMPAREPMQPLTSLERKQDFQTLWHIPYLRNAFFTGREKILDDLRHALGKRKCAALSGLGGMGKTQTAIEFAYRHRALYTAVFWAKAETREKLMADFVSMAVVLNLPSAHAKEQEVTITEVKRWLENHPGWLLILDNADDLALVMDFLPHDSQGHMLFTTRTRALGGLAQRLSMEEMLPEEGALLLLRRAGLVANDGSLAAVSQADRSLALQVSQELGGLPLALDQAGAFIEETPSSLSEYLSLYRSERGKLLAERGSLGDHPSVVVTFSLAFAKVAVNSTAAADLIRLCAFLAPDGIPEEIFSNSAGELGDDLGAAACSSLEFAKTLKEAGRFSLLDRDTQTKTLGIHRLVQVVVKLGMSKTDQNHWAARAVRAVAKVFPSVEFNSWESCQKLLPHAQVCEGLVDEWDIETQDAAVLLNEVGRYLHERGLFDEAEPFYRRALAISEKVLRPDHPDVATSLNNLAALCIDQGKYVEAEPLHRRALSILEKALGSDHPRVAASLNNLAMLYRDQGKFSEAELLHGRALATREAALSPDHPEVATSLNNLALLYMDQGKYAEAEPLHRRALSILEKALGPYHPRVAQCLSNLAFVYDYQQKYAEAEPLHFRALSIREKALGPNHPHVATSLNNLAQAYWSQGKYVEAELVHLRALAILEAALSPNHPNLATSLNNLGLLYKDQTKYAEAEPLLTRALAIREKVLGPDHPDMATSLNNLAELYDGQGRSAEVEPLHVRALAILEKALGPDHPHVATSLNNLAQAYWRQGKYAEAEPLHVRALAIREKALGPDHPDIADSLNNLALVYDGQGRNAEAEPLFQRALSVIDKTLGPDHPTAFIVRSNLDKTNVSGVHETPRVPIEQKGSPDPRPV